MNELILWIIFSVVGGLTGWLLYWRERRRRLQANQETARWQIAFSELKGAAETWQESARVWKESSLVWREAAETYQRSSNTWRNLYMSRPVENDEAREDDESFNEDLIN